MELSPKLASRITSEVRQVMKEDIILVDINGFIISSTEKSRVGSFHEGAEIVIKTKQKLYIDKEKAATLKGVKAGINMPIMFNHQVIGVVGITGNPKKVEPYAELIRRMTELIIQEAYYTERHEWEIRGIESYIHEWLNAVSIDNEFLENGMMLGIPVASPLICALIHLDIKKLSNYKMSKLQKDVIVLFHSIFGENNSFIIRWGQENFLVLKKAGPTHSKSSFHYQLKKFKDSFERRHLHSLSIGVGKSICKHHIKKTYKEAQKALNVAQKSKGIVFYEDLILEIILEDIPAEIQTDFLKQTIYKMKEEKHLIYTLQQYIKNNQSIKNTADVMNIHINTLHYRLNKIEELIGICPKTTEGVVILYIALMLLNNHRK